MKRLIAALIRNMPNFLRKGAGDGDTLVSKLKGMNLDENYAEIIRGDYPSKMKANAYMVELLKDQTYQSSSFDRQDIQTSVPMLN